MRARVAGPLFLTVIAVYGGSAVDVSEYSLDSADLHAKWTAYKERHSKQYDLHEEKTRKAIFLERTRVIEEHNARFHQGLESFKMGHNKMSDLTMEELKQRYMGLEMPPNVEEMRANVPVHVAPESYYAPDKFDWRYYKGVSPVKDQGNCASCYVFAVAAALESAHWRRWRVLPDISEQDLMDCSPNGRCRGGWMDSVFKWLQGADGYVAEKSDPYKAQAGKCFHNDTCKIGKLSEYYHVAKYDETGLVHAVFTAGPVAVTYNGVHEKVAYYESGIIDIPDCGTAPTHTGLIVGYGIENNTYYWIIKNSWDTDWGESGYLRMRRYVNMCGISEHAVYPLVY